MADRIGVELTGDNSKFASMIDHSSTLVGKFNGVLGKIGLGISAIGVVSFFKSVIDSAGELQDLSDRLGVSTDTLQAFEFHAKLAGANLNDVAGIFDKARKSIDGLMNGQTASVAMFEKLHLSAKDFIGLNLEQAIEVIARAYKDGAGEAGTYDAVTDIMGTKTVPKLNAVLLQYGAEGAQAFIDKTKEMGVIASGETIKKLDDIGDKFTLITAKASTAGKQLVVWVDELNTKAEQLVKGALGKVGIHLPFEKAATEAKKVQESVAQTIPVVDKLTEVEKENLKNTLKKTEEERKLLDHSERLNLLYTDELNLQNALAQQGVSKGVQEALNLTLEETRKQIKIEEAALNADEAKHQDKMIEFTKKELEDEREKLTFKQQLGLLREDEAGWLAVLGDMELTAEQRRYAELELAKTRAKMRDVELDKKREDFELANLLLIPATELTEADKLRLAVLQGTVTQRELDAEKTALMAGLVAGTLTEAEKNRLRVLMDQKQVLDQQLATAQAITTTVNRTGKSVDQQSDDSLEGARQRLREQIQRLQRDRFGQIGGVGRIGGAGPSAEEYLLQSELANLEKEQRDRQEVRDYANRFGEQKARQYFGDTRFDQAMRDFTNQQARTTTAIEDIQQRLANIFPKNPK